MKRPLLTYSLLVLLAILLGGGIAIGRIVFWNDASATIENGVWRGRKQMELGNDELLLTARIATQATFALRSSEVLYFIAAEDENGDPLTAENEYIIEGNGKELKARYWSITLYADDYLLVENDQKRYSYNRDNLTYSDSTQTSFKVQLSNQTSTSENKIPTPSAGRFYLLLRMYHADEQVYKAPEAIVLPKVRRVSQ